MPQTPICSVAVSKTEKVFDLSKDTERNLCEVETGNEIVGAEFYLGQPVGWLVGWHRPNSSSRPRSQIAVG